MKDWIQHISVNGIVAVSLCASLLSCLMLGQTELAQNLSAGLLGFLSRSAIK